MLRPFPSSMRAATNTPAEPVGARVARFPTAGSLPRVSGGSASALPVSRPARRSLHVAALMVAEPPKAALCHRSASNDVVTSSIRSDCFRLERQLPGGIRTRWGMAPSHGAQKLWVGENRPLKLPVNGLRMGGRRAFQPSGVVRLGGWCRNGGAFCSGVTPPGPHAPGDNGPRPWAAVARGWNRGHTRRVLTEIPMTPGELRCIRAIVAVVAWRAHRDVLVRFGTSPRFACESNGRRPRRTLVDSAPAGLYFCGNRRR